MIADSWKEIDLFIKSAIQNRTIMIFKRFYINSLLSKII